MYPGRSPARCGLRPPLRQRATEKAVPESDPALQRIERVSLMACAALAAAAAILTGGVEAPLGVAGGGALVAISYRGIKGGITAVVDRGASAGGRPKAVTFALVKFFTRYAILALAAYV